MNKKTSTNYFKSVLSHGVIQAFKSIESNPDSSDSGGGNP